MKPAVDFAQAVAGDVGVDFRGADVGVVEQFLDHAQIRAVLQQISRSQTGARAFRPRSRFGRRGRLVLK